MRKWTTEVDIKYKVMCHCTTVTCVVIQQWHTLLHNGYFQPNISKRAVFITLSASKMAVCCTSRCDRQQEQQHVFFPLTQKPNVHPTRSGLCYWRQLAAATCCHTAAYVWLSLPHFNKIGHILIKFLLFCMNGLYKF